MDRAALDVYPFDVQLALLAHGYTEPKVTDGS